MVDPWTGAEIKIQSYKHNGHVHRVWKQNIVLKRTKEQFITFNDRTEVLEGNGRTWETREPAISYFYAKHWFNIIGMIRNDGLHYYCNLSSPYVFEDRTLKYIDYDVDVKVYPDLSYEILDVDEFQDHQRLMGYPPQLIDIIYAQTDHLLHWIKERKGPFTSGAIDDLYGYYLKHQPSMYKNTDF